MNNSSYGSLSRAQLSYDYLHTNSTTHEFLFGALAELVDNARDANATRLSIFTLYDDTLRGSYMLCFLDDGEGMDPSETADIITFGRSSKRSLDDHLIGMYGNGLKSGSMRIGNDLIVFTKKNDTMTCLFISRTFHEEETIDEVIVPIPAFEIGTRTPIDKSAGAAEKFAVEMDVILRYSPFHTEDDFFAQFDRIDGDSGTLVVVYNLKLLDSGEPEIDVLSDSTDLLLANPASDFDSDEGLVLERRSFRAYTAILYMDPRMKVYIQGKKVRTKKLASCLYKPKLYKYGSNRFKSRSEIDCRKAQDDAKAAELRAKEAQSKAKALENKGGNLSKDARAEIRKAQQYAAEIKREAQLRRDFANRKLKALKDPKLMNLIFGINIDNRSHDGVFVYNCSRLIKMYEKVGPQNDGGVATSTTSYCSGVIGIVDVPYVVLEPTHNKQDFADAKEYRHLLKAMGEHMIQYWKDISIAQQGVLKFWENFGYVSQKWKDSPSDDSKFIRKRAMQLSVTLQCDACLKWRTLPFSSNNIGKDFSDSWTCSQNPDSQHNKCTTAEQKLNIPESVLKKEAKTQDQKSKDLEKEIKKKQEMLEKLHKNRVVTSSRELQEMDRKKEAEIRKKKELEEQRIREEEEQQRQREMEERRKKKETEDKQKQKEEEKRKKKETEEKQKKKELAEKQRRKDQEERQKKKQQEEKERQKKRDTEDKQKKKSAEEKKKREAEEKKTARNTRESPLSTLRSNSRSSVNKEAVKRRATEAVSTQADDSESESDIEAPVKRSRAVNSTDNGMTPTGRRNIRTARIANIEKKKETTATRGSKGTQVEEPETSEEEMETEVSEPAMDETEDTNLSASEGDTNGEVGTKVEAFINNKWFNGLVVKVNAKEEKWKVKFDHNSKDKYDKWFDKNSSNIRLLKPSASKSSYQGPPSPASISSHDTTAEAPTSSTSASAAPVEPQVTEEIANGYRTCLRYFLPPQWIMDKDSISAMSPQELATFPLDDFFDHYEKGLRKLVNNFQTEASLRKQEAETANNKLSSVRKMIAKLLTSSNEEFNIDPDCDGEQVDQFLEACLQASGGAVAGSTGNSDPGDSSPTAKTAAETTPTPTPTPTPAPTPAPTPTPETNS